MRQNEDLKCIDQLIAGIGGTAPGAISEGRCGLLLEHLRAARRGLLGSMRKEYGLSLRQAKESVACIADKNARTETKRALGNLIDAIPK